jgi:hypothetical protein
MGDNRKHMPIFEEFQWCLANNVGIRNDIRISSQENMGKAVENREDLFACWLYKPLSCSSCNKYFKKRISKRLTH